MSRIASIVQLPPIPVSVDGNAAFWKIAGVPAIERLVNRLHAGLPEWPIYLLCPDEHSPRNLPIEISSISKALKTCECGRLATLATFCLQHPEIDTLALFHPYSLFPDCSSARAMALYHVPRGAPENRPMRDTSKPANGC